MNDELNRELENAFGADVPYDESKHAKAVEEAVKMYQEKNRRTCWLTWGYLVAATVAILALFAGLMAATSVKMMFVYALLILIFHECTVLMKLWWWVYSSRNTTLAELKKLQLQVAELASQKRVVGSD